MGKCEAGNEGGTGRDKKAERKELLHQRATGKEHRAEQSASDLGSFRFRLERRLAG